MDIKDTIYGEMTFPGRSALRTIRVSGELSQKAVTRLFDRGSALLKNPNRVFNGKLLDLRGKVVDDIVCIFFQKPKSYTGEDIVEFHCHGSEGIIRILSSSLESLGIRKAKNGEFSFRAFLEGKISLKEARRLKKIMEAQTELESSVAFESQDIIERELGFIKEKIIKLLSIWEARIDFPEEVPQKETNRWKDELIPLQKRIKKLLEKSASGKKIREGFKVAIFGAPNSGKSSLFNTLLGRERAIVTPHPGTTRDILEETLDVEGIPITFLDMAGVRNTSRKIEKKGVEKALKEAKIADLVLFLFDGKKGWKKSDEEFLALLSQKNVIKVATKKDLYKKKVFSEGVFEISNLSGFGISRLLRKISSELKKNIPDNNFLFLQKEEYSTIEKVSSLFNEAYLTISKGEDALSADLLKRALFEIDRLFKIDSFESIYDSIFSDFCIGK